MNDQTTGDGMITYEKTGRGFGRGEFRDWNGDECSIQESSIATENLIWLGQNKRTHHMGDCLARMHLTRDMARALAIELMRFADTGSLLLAERPRRACSICMEVICECGEPYL